MKQRLAILGSTGSIGTSTLDVVARHPERFDVFALTAHTRADLLFDQCARWRPAFAVLHDEAQAKELERRLRAQGVGTRVLAGALALQELAAHESVDTVMAAIVGAAGLAPCLAAARSGKRLLLANKEALVVGGQWFMDAVRAGGATLLPIDSEHSAVFQSLPQERTSWSRRIDRIILTASGGPFRTRDPATLSDVTPDEACAHPNFAMGRKISVDSATMMNKALEVIEARWLFDVAPEQIEVVVHPQQIVHSMVQYRDASIVAQLGTPDMRVPIAYGLSWPERMESGADRLDFSRLAAMSFEAPDERRFPCLRLAWTALAAPEGSTAVLNAANEVAVGAFLERRIGFQHIAAVVEETLSRARFSKPGALDELLAIDAEARALASQAVAGLKGI